MDKKSLIALIYKDLYELKVLTNGFSEMEYFPKTLVDLAVDKTKNIADCLQKLPMNAYEYQELFFDFVQEPITKSQEQIKNQNIETHAFAKIKEKFEFFEEPKVEDKVLEETIMEEKLEPQIEITEAKNSAEQQIIEEIVEEVEVKVEKPAEKIIFQGKATDLKQPFGISIADRFRFQRELFDGNGEKFSKSLTILNEMDTLEQAQNYITQNLKLNLQNPDVQSFIDILKRKLV